jgi:hypothetical protein
MIRLLKTTPVFELRKLENRTSKSHIFVIFSEKRLWTAIKLWHRLNNVMTHQMAEFYRNLFPLRVFCERGGKSTPQTPHLLATPHSFKTKIELIDLHYHTKFDSIRTYRSRDIRVQRKKPPLFGPPLFGNGPSDFIQTVPTERPCGNEQNI